MYTLYSLTSELHSEPVAEPADERFIQDIEKALGEAFEFGSTDFSEYSRTRNNIIYVRTGGTEGIFKSIFCKEGSLNIPDGMPVRLLTSGKSNSLAASMEILSFLNRPDGREKSFTEARRRSPAGSEAASRRAEKAM